jgi:hypothetical protein
MCYVKSVREGWALTRKNHILAPFLTRIFAFECPDLNSYKSYVSGNGANAQLLFLHPLVKFALQPPVLEIGAFLAGCRIFIFYAVKFGNFANTRKPV